MVAQAGVGRSDGGKLLKLSDVVSCMGGSLIIRVKVSQKYDHVRFGFPRHLHRLFQQGKARVYVRQDQDAQAGKAGQASGRGLRFTEFQSVGLPLHVGKEQRPQKNGCGGQVKELAEQGTFFGGGGSGSHE